ncbi:hypothetical protein [Bradyrhizobium sp. CCBAU 11357]|uniref:hypothetical protein n=1 Tax=Bradyrhizobium sp. CCBAU 11357 TaxID=1630808 RepID=UPI002FE0F5C2
MLRLAWAVAGIAVGFGLRANRTAISRGLFLNRTRAFKYALSKNGHHPETIVEVSREMEFDVPAHLQIVSTSSAN